MKTKIIKTCIKCHENFELTMHHIGYSTICPSCNTDGDVIRYMAKVAYPSKNSSLVEIEFTKDIIGATNFNRAQRRNGAGPLSSIIAARETSVGAESAKVGSGAENHATYINRVGEKRTVRL